MAQYSFKIFPEIDPELIRWLDSLTRRRRSEEIRKALRVYFRREEKEDKKGLRYSMRN